LHLCWIGYQFGRKMTFVLATAHEDFSTGTQEVGRSRAKEECRGVG
jgi:hypothetical protein